MELPAIEARLSDFAQAGAQVLGISVDSTASHKAFAEQLKVTFPLLSDFHRDVSRRYGVLLNDEGMSARSTVIVDRNGEVQYQLTHALNQRRDEGDWLRYLKQLQR